MKIKHFISCILIITFAYTSVPVYAGMDFSGLGSSPVEERLYMIINDKELKTRKGIPIESLVTPEEVARAPLYERIYFHDRIGHLYEVLKSTGSPRAEAVEALYNATGLREEKEYMIINGRELRTGSGIPIESLVTPEEVARASKKERGNFYDKIEPLYRSNKSRGSRRVKAIEDLLNATGFRRPEGYVSSIDITSLTVRRAFLRKNVREGKGDKNKHLKKINLINERLIEMGVNTKILPGESSSPVSDSIKMLDGEVGSVVYSGSVVVDYEN